MARLPKFLNLSAAGRVRLALPAAKLALIAFSCTMAVVGMGAFVATLPALSADSSVIDAAGGDSADGEKRGAAEGEEPDGEAEAGEDAGGEAGEAQGGDAADGSGTAAGTSAGAASVGGSAAAAGGSGATSGGASSGSGSSGASGSSGSAASSGSNSGSGSNSSSDSNSSSISDSGATSGSSNAAAEEEVSSVPADDPFSKIPTAAEEEAFHTFLANWYAKFPQAEAESRAGDSTIAWDGYIATLNYVRSNYSQWCKTQENMIGAFRCLGEWNGDDANHRDSYNQYLTWKSGIVL